MRGIKAVRMRRRRGSGWAVFIAVLMRAMRSAFLGLQGEKLKVRIGSASWSGLDADDSRAVSRGWVNSPLYSSCWDWIRGSAGNGDVFVVIYLVFAYHVLAMLRQGWMRLGVEF